MSRLENIHNNFITVVDPPPDLTEEETDTLRDLEIEHELERQLARDERDEAFDPCR